MVKIAIATCQRDGLRGSTVRKRTGALERLSLAFGGTKTHFDTDLLTNENFLSKLVKWLDEKDYSLSTKAGYVDAILSLCKSEKVHDVINYACYKPLENLYEELVLQRDSQPSSVVIYPDVIEKLDDVDDVSPNMQIMRSVIKNFGAIREDDLIHTRLIDDGKHNYLDLQNKVWKMRAEYTKNKKNREFVVPQEFIDDTADCFKKDQEWLLLTKSGNNYITSQSISSNFNITFGMTYQSARKSESSVSNKTSTIKDLKDKSNVLGHRLKVHMKHYDEPVHEESDISKDLTCEDQDHVDIAPVTDQNLVYLNALLATGRPHIMIIENGKTIIKL